VPAAKLRWQRGQVLPAAAAHAAVDLVCMHLEMRTTVLTRQQWQVARDGKGVQATSYRQQREGLMRGGLAIAHAILLLSAGPQRQPCCTAEGAPSASTSRASTGGCKPSILQKL